jgi:transcriptional regulator with XRE-family HTH domain
MQRTVAEQLRVRVETIGLWEKGRVRPLPRHYSRIVQFLGYDPEPEGEGLPDRLRAVRRRCGLTQAELAARLGQDEHQICRWERGRLKPHPWIADRLDHGLRALEGQPAESSPAPSFFELTRWRRKPPMGVTILPATFGEQVRARRLYLRLSMEALGRRVGSNRGTIYRLERGKQTPSARLQEKLREVLGEAPRDLSPIALEE